MRHPAGGGTAWPRGASAEGLPRRRGPWRLAVAVGLAVLASSGCTGLYLYETSSLARYASPPATPAHGYRHRQPDGTLLEYDARRELYVVVGAPQHYYSQGRYYRLGAGGWEASDELGGDWRAVDREAVPPGL